MNSEPQRPRSDDHHGWPVYWSGQGMPWRTEPEIDEDRQQFLAKRRGAPVDIWAGIYPFRDEHGSIRLTRADLEWLLATNESNGVRGPVDWRDALHTTRQGPDIRGADLHGLDLRGLPLSRLRASLEYHDWIQTTFREHEMSGTNLQDTRLEKTHLEGADLATHLERAQLAGAYLQRADLGEGYLQHANLRDAHLEQSELIQAHLEGAELYEAHLEGANLRLSYMDVATELDGIGLTSKQYGAVRLADVRWGGANLGVIRWKTMRMLGDERAARTGGKSERPTHAERIQDGHGPNVLRLEHYREAERANRQLARQLREQGLNDDADYFAYRAQLVHRLVLIRERQILPFLGSLFLAAIAGYGFRPRRSVIAYVVVILGFAAAYYGLSLSTHSPLPFNEALVISMTSFHGRGFFSTAFQPGDPQAAVAAIEALVGLLIEITLIATFTQRYFAH